MACFFCDSLFHVSHNCNNYVSDESRQRRTTLKKCCSTCLNPMLINSGCDNSESQQKCYICFSSTHHTVYCPDRKYASKITPKIDNDLMCRFRKISSTAKHFYRFFGRMKKCFLDVSVCPKIDDDLFSRFFKLLNKEEKYILAINNPTVFNAAKLKHIKVTSKKRLSFKNIYQMFQGSDFISIDEGICVKNDLKEFQNPVPSSPPLPIVYISNLEITGSKFSSADLLQLLSAKTKILKCKFTQFRPKFREILENAPKLEGINIYQSNIEINSLWPEDLLQYSRCNNLQYLYLHIPNIDFNTESLVKVIKVRKYA